MWDTDIASRKYVWLLERRNHTRSTAVRLASPVTLQKSGTMHKNTVNKWVYEVGGCQWCVKSVWMFWQVMIVIVDCSLHSCFSNRWKSNLTRCRVEMQVYLCPNNGWIWLTKLSFCDMCTNSITHFKNIVSNFYCVW